MHANGIRMMSLQQPNIAFKWKVPLVVALKQVYTTRHRAYTTYATRCSANKTLQKRPLLTQFRRVRRGSIQLQITNRRIKHNLAPPIVAL